MSAKAGTKRRATSTSGPKPAKKIKKDTPAKKIKKDTPATKAKGGTGLPHDLQWGNHGDEAKGVCPLITLTSSTTPGRTKVAGFDIDWTLIQTKSGKTFPTGAKDWKWWDDCVPEKLQEKDKKGFRVCLFTNQGGIEKLKAKPEDVKQKIEAMVKAVGIPMFVYICTGSNQFRKPSCSMWEFFEKNHNKGVQVNRAQSIYVGDAAGRPKNWAPGKTRDFNCSDRMFAKNVGCKFNTPDTCFLGEKEARKYKWGSIDPVAFLAKAPKPAAREYHKKHQELVILMGVPASGKSTFCKRYFEPHGYARVNRDTMGTVSKCIKIARDALEKGQSVVADNTHPSAPARLDFVRLAKEQDIPYRCIWLKTPKDLAHHLNFVRQNQTNGEIKKIPDIAYNMFTCNFQEPTMKEGFSEILEVDFVPEFANKRDEDLFKQWTA